MNPSPGRASRPLDIALPAAVGGLGLLVVVGVTTGRLGDGRFAWPWFPLAHLVLAPVAAALVYRLARPAATPLVLVALASWGALSTAISFAVASVLAFVVPWDPWLPSPLVALDVGLFLGWGLGLTGVFLASTRVDGSRSAVVVVAAAPPVQAVVTLLPVSLL